MITRAKINELRDLLVKVMTNHQGEFSISDQSWDHSTADMCLTLQFSDQHPNEEFRGCTHGLGEDIPPEAAKLIATALNNLSDLLDAAEQTVKRAETIW
jgi:hypothetical protein